MNRVMQQMRRTSGGHLPNSGRDRPPGRCKRSCCWTPLGHSPIRDNHPIDTVRCHCHTRED